MIAKDKKYKLYAQTGEIILSKGINRFNISYLCKNTSISKKTFYKDFSSKQDFLAKFYLDLLHKSYYEIISTIQNNNTFFEKFENIAKIVQKRSVYFNVNILSVIEEKFPEVLVQINNFKQNRILPLFTLLIENAQKHNMINNFDPKTILNLFFSIISSHSIITTKREISDTKTEFTEIFQILLKGVLTKKGKNFLNKC
ncbi:MAG: TetR/AcrR family transcriptional regulator [Ignavibacteriales bacterium]|nr:TetR/AcrR family transcriptional regulator [Ignavibacteriales bacterium]